MAQWTKYLNDEERALYDRLQRRASATAVIVDELQADLSTLRERAQKRRTRAKQKEA